MRAIVGKLSAVYHEELTLYQHVLGLVEKERDALAQCRPLGEVIESFQAKRDILRRIGSMERSIAEEKTEYKHNKTLLDPYETSRLNETVKTIKQLIQRILEIEEQNEETILEHGRPTEIAVAALGEE